MVETALLVFEREHSLYDHDGHIRKFLPAHHHHLLGQGRLDQGEFQAKEVHLQVYIGGREMDKIWQAAYLKLYTAKDYGPLLT